MGEQIFPEPIVAAVILNSEEKVLLVKSPKWSRKYTIPGGHVEIGEGSEEALRREIKEETGLEIYGIKFIDFQDVIYSKEFWKKKHFLTLDFLCRTKSKKVVLNKEGTEYIWADPKKALKEFDLAKYTRTTLEKFVKSPTGKWAVGNGVRDMNKK